MCHGLRWLEQLVVPRDCDFLRGEAIEVIWATLDQEASDSSDIGISEPEEDGEF